MIFVYEDIFEIRNRGVVLMVRGEIQEGDLIVGQTNTFWKAGSDKAFDARIIGLERMRKCLCIDSDHKNTYGVLVPRTEVPEEIYPRR